MPEDLEEIFKLEEYFEQEEELFEIGARLATNPKAGAHIDTAHITQEQEADLIEPMLAGMLAVD
jgi:hypothetical protein